MIDYTSALANVIMETESSAGSLTYRYVYGLQKLSVSVSPITTGAGNLIQNGRVKLWYHQDRLGSTDFLTNNISGTATSYVAYDDWGAPTMKAILKLGLRELDLVTSYTGHQYDPVLGIYYAKARMYDPATSRWLSPDPFKGTIANPQTLVQYTYCENNPILFIDPFGLERIIISGNHTGTYATRNFIEPAIKALRSWFSAGDIRESITWMIVDDGYNNTDKMNIWGAVNRIKADYSRNFNTALPPSEGAFPEPAPGPPPPDYSNIKFELKERGKYLRVLWISTKEDVINHINSGISRAQEKITQIIVFSHGTAGTLALGHSTKQEANISINDLISETIEKSAFTQNYFCVFYSCNTGTDSVNDEVSFAQKWADVTGGYVLGIQDTQSSYVYINENRSWLWVLADRVKRAFGTNFDITGSLYYPEIKRDAANGQWMLYQPNITPIHAGNIMSKYTLPTLFDINKLLT